VVFAFDGRGREVVAEAEVQGQPGGELDIVLAEEREHAQALIDEIEVGEGGLLHIAEEAVGVREPGAGYARPRRVALAGEDEVEVDLAAGGGHVHVVVAEGQAKVAAELELVAAAGEHHAVGELILLRNLVFGEKVGRADERVEVGEGGAGDAAGDGLVVGHAGDVIRDLVLAVRVLLGVGIVAQEAGAEFVHHAGRDDAGPAEREAVGSEMLAALRGGGRAIGDAAEVAGREGTAHGGAKAGEDAVLRGGLPIGAPAVAVGVVHQAGVAGEIVGLAREVGGLREEVE
jgi:hypothetical protein